MMLSSHSFTNMMLLLLLLLSFTMGRHHNPFVTHTHYNVPLTQCLQCSTISWDTTSFALVWEGGRGARTDVLRIQAAHQKTGRKISGEQTLMFVDNDAKHRTSMMMMMGGRCFAGMWVLHEKRTTHSSVDDEAWRVRPGRRLWAAVAILCYGSQ